LRRVITWVTNGDEVLDQWLCGRGEEAIACFDTGGDKDRR